MEDSSKLAAIEVMAKNDHAALIKTTDKLDKINETLAHVSEILSQLTKTQQESSERLLLLEHSRVTEETLQSLNNRLDNMEADIVDLRLKPAKKWDSFTGYITLTIVSGLIGYFISCFV